MLNMYQLFQPNNKNDASVRSFYLQNQTNNYWTLLMGVIQGKAVLDDKLISKGFLAQNKWTSEPWNFKFHWRTFHICRPKKKSLSRKNNFFWI